MLCIHHYLVGGAVSYFIKDLDIDKYNTNPLYIKLSFACLIVLFFLPIPGLHGIKEALIPGLLVTICLFMRKGSFFRVLNSKMFAYLGSISYEMYLIHFIIYYVLFYYGIHSESSIETDFYRIPMFIIVYISSIAVGDVLYKIKNI